MLSGTARVDELLMHTATLPDFSTAAVCFPDALVVQAMCETSAAARTESLPAGLHPTNPPTMVFQAWQCAESPWGAFSLAQARVGCRSGLRPRGMVQGCVCDNAEAAVALRSRWGFPVQLGAVHIDANYHDVSVRVRVDGSDALVLSALDPQPLGADDVSYATTVALAHTPRGLRLVQIDTDLAVTRAERVRLEMPMFSAAAFGVHPSVVPTSAVSASVSRGALTLHPLRYVSHPDVLAFTGTESVNE